MDYTDDLGRKAKEMEMHRGRGTQQDCTAKK